MSADAQPELSVVVATRNRADLLPSCLGSLTAQTTAAQLEIVVVDNGSEDDTSTVVRNWARRDPRIGLVVEPAIGLSQAKNAGIRNVLASIVAFTDDDVILDPRWVEAYVAFFRDRPYEPLVLAGGPVLPIAPDLSRWPSWLSDAAQVDLPRVHHGSEERLLGRFDYLWGANMAARRELFDRIGGFDETLGPSGDLRGSFEDVELNERVAAAGGECVYLPGAIVHHRVGWASVRPRAVVNQAFNRGANDVLRAGRGSYFEPSTRVPATRLAAAAGLPLGLAAWTGCAVAFRIARRPGLFEVVRRSAWASGWCLATSCARHSGRGPGLLRRLGLLGRALALRATPR